jgi:hypothetical protein
MLIAFFMNQQYIPVFSVGGKDLTGAVPPPMITG